MSKVYKLQRYTSNGTWEDIQLGEEQQNTLQTYLTLSEASNYFLAKDIIQTGSQNPSLQFSDLQGAAISSGALAFAKHSAAVGNNSSTFGEGSQINLDGLSFFQEDGITNPLYTETISIDSLGIVSGSIIKAERDNQCYVLEVRETRAVISNDIWISEVYFVESDEYSRFIGDFGFLNEFTFTLVQHYAKGNNSMVVGKSLKAIGDSQLVCGRYNERNSSALFIVGGGNESTTKNLFSVEPTGIKCQVPVSYRPEEYGGSLSIHWDYDSEQEAWTPKTPIPAGRYLVSVFYAPDDQDEAWEACGWCYVGSEQSSFCLEYLKPNWEEADQAQQFPYYIRAWKAGAKKAWHIYMSYYETTTTTNPITGELIRTIKWLPVSNSSRQNFFIIFRKLY